MTTDKRTEQLVHKKKSEEEQRARERRKKAEEGAAWCNSLNYFARRG